MNKKLKQNTCLTKSVDLENKIIEMVGSTEDYDRCGDKMYMSGVDLTNFKKNPIILPNHDYHATAIGKCLDVYVEGTSLIFKIKFAETESGAEWFYLYSNGYMNASSIGFTPIEFSPNSEGGYDFKKWELLELSLVTIPCNQNAIQRMKKEFAEGNITKSMYEHLSKLGQFNHNEEDLQDMSKEDLQKLIDESVNTAVKSLNEEHDNKINEKQAEIDKLSAELEDVKKELNSKKQCNDTKKGELPDAILSACDNIVKELEAIKGCFKPAKSMDEEDVANEDDKSNKNDEAKEYSDEQIAELVNASIEKLLNSYNA